MAYPSVISQQGSAARNVEPVLAALEPLVASGSSDSGRQRKIMELASYPYEHIQAYARRWPEVDWWGTCRDSRLIDSDVMETTRRASVVNIRPPRQLDMAVKSDWRSLANAVAQERGGPFEGVIMRLPEQIFKHLSPCTSEGRTLLDPLTGWIAAYGAYLNDDGSYRSPGDAKFDAEHIRATHATLGLRTPNSISNMARRWGFAEESRTDMPNGNLWIVWRVASPGDIQPA